MRRRGRSRRRRRGGRSTGSGRVDGVDGGASARRCGGFLDLNVRPYLRPESLNDPLSHERLVVETHTAR